MKLTLFILLLFIFGTGYSQKDNKDSVCFYVRNNISINDEEPWRIVHSESCPIQKFSFQLFNRWGSLLFDAKSLEEVNSFNPFVTQRNPKVNFETGTYSWRMTYSLIGNKNVLKEEGFLTIIR